MKRPLPVIVVISRSFGKWSRMTLIQNLSLKAQNMEKPKLDRKHFTRSFYKVI